MKEFQLDVFNADIKEFVTGNIIDKINQEISKILNKTVYFRIDTSFYRVVRTIKDIKYPKAKSLRLDKFSNCSFFNEYRHSMKLIKFLKANENEIKFN